MNIILGNRDSVYNRSTDRKTKGHKTGQAWERAYRFDVHDFSPGVLKVGKGICVKSISCACVVALIASKGMGSVYTS